MLRKLIDKYPILSAAIIFAAILIFAYLVKKFFSGKPSKPAVHPANQTKMALGGVAHAQFLGGRQSQPTSSSDDRTNKAKNHCWIHDWYDNDKRSYHFEIWAADCNAPYVTDAINLISAALNNGNLNGAGALNMPLGDVVNEILYELNGDKMFYPEIHAGLLQFKIAGNEVWGTSTPPHPQPPPVKPPQTTNPCVAACKAQYNKDIAGCQQADQQCYDNASAVLQACEAKCPSKPDQPIGGGTAVPEGFNECWHGKFVDSKKSHLSHLVLEVSIWSETSCRNKIVEQNVNHASQFINNYINMHLGIWNSQNITKELQSLNSQFGKTYSGLLMSYHWNKI